MELDIREGVRLAGYTTLHVGGEAKYLIEVKTSEELQAALRFAREQTTTAPLILGSGSNVLVGDTGYDGVVIVVKITGRTYEEDQSVITLTCGAGEILDVVVAETAEKGLWGLENLSSIPGTIGATPVQNVGAYGVEVSGLIPSLRAVNVQSGEEKVFSAEACQFSYRDSFFKSPAGRDWVITEVTFTLEQTTGPQLSYGSLTELQEIPELTPTIVRQAIQRIRAEKFPDWTVVGTAGSFFKNPIITEAHATTLLQQYPDIPTYPAVGGVKVSLGYILDKVCGLRGHTDGAVRLYEAQALVLVAERAATAGEIKKFVEKVTAIVFEKTNITIEPEVRIL